MLFKYSFVTFVLAGAHAHEAQDTVRRLRQQRYAKSNKASKRVRSNMLYYFTDTFLGIERT